MTRSLVAALVVLIVVAHVFLWRSGMPSEAKLAFTLINTVAWTIVLAPIFLVDKWLAAIQERNAGLHEREVTGEPK